MRVAVVGLGTAGCALACLLADDGHDVTVLEAAADPRPVGAGLWLQAAGQRVLDRLDLLAPLRERSQPVDRVDVRTAGGRPLLDLAYSASPGAVPALGVHRGDLFALLHAAVRRRGIAVRLGVRVTEVRPTPSGIVTDPSSGDDGSAYDLVVGADGARSAVRAATGVTRRDRPYPYGALWSVVDDPGGSAGSALYQCLDGTRTYLGVLPTGRGRASVFWSAPTRDFARLLGEGLPAWRTRARRFAGPHGALLDRVAELLPATYRDVVLHAPYRVADGRHGAVLVGDAAHAMSPQLGAGASLALADAWSLSRALTGATGRSLPTALAAYAADRAAHWRWYGWCSRLMVPVFQSDLTPLALPRDLLAPVVSTLPGVAPLLVGTLSGDATSPRGRWRPPA